MQLFHHKKQRTKYLRYRNRYETTPTIIQKHVSDKTEKTAEQIPQSISEMQDYHLPNSFRFSYLHPSAALQPSPPTDSVPDKA